MILQLEIDGLVQDIYMLEGLPGWNLATAAIRQGCIKMAVNEMMQTQENIKAIDKAKNKVEFWLVAESKVNDVIKGLE